MAKYPRLQRRKSGYYFRARVPEELISIIGKKEVTKSLGTFDRREAIQKTHQQSVLTDAEFAEARHKLTPRPINELTEAEVTQIALLWFHRAEMEEFKNFDPPVDPDELIAPDQNAVASKMLRGGQSNQQIKATEQRIADELLSEAGIANDPASPQYQSLCALIRRAVTEHF